MEQSQVIQTAKIILSSLFVQFRSLQSQKESVKATLASVDYTIQATCFFYISLPVNYLFQYVAKDCPSENTQSICFYVFYSLSIIYYILLDCKILCYRDYTVHMLHIYSTVNHLLYVIILQQILLQRLWSPYVSQEFYYLSVIYYRTKNFFAESIQPISSIYISL